jgi:glucosamine-6-phosphate deaminase
VLPSSGEATLAAAERAASVLTSPGTRNVMVAGGNTPLPLYAEIARRCLDLRRLNVFALDEYVGVPREDPRTCGGLLRRSVVEPWGVPAERYHALETSEAEAEESIRTHELRIREEGGLDLVVLGLGRNGHVGFNEPGSRADSSGRVVPLEPVSIEANRRWFGGEHAPALGVTTGLALILQARAVVLLAFGREKADAVRAMACEPPSEACPASFLQLGDAADVYLDAEAALLLPRDAAAGTSRLP